MSWRLASACLEFPRRRKCKLSAARRQNPTRRSGARRGHGGSVPAFYWFLGGLTLGLGIAAIGYYGGYLPERPDRQPGAGTASEPVAEAELLESPQGIAPGDRKSRFDFFTVLPDMEVVVPDQELSRGSSATDPAALDGSGNYILQIGSFRAAADAEQLKAQLALRGHVAVIQLVTVNDETWHRVRIGPVTGARRTDEIRRSLLEHGFETLVVKAN
jgi:hypothetical protein